MGMTPTHVPSARNWGQGSTIAQATIMNNRLEQDHRDIKQRYSPMRGFGSFASAARFCVAHDELRDHFRYRRRLNETVPLADQRRLFQERWGAVCLLLHAA